MNAFLRKEFRESVRWLPLGWLLIGGLLWANLPGLEQLDKVMELATSLGVFLAIGSSFIALGLSIAQFAPDQRSAARAFLMHRGLSPKQLFQGKLIIGVAVYAMAIWLPLLVATLYLEWIGPLRLPTSARQTIPAWVMSVYAFSFYFGGVMLACSNARWIGTRVLPLALAAMVTMSGMSTMLSNLVILNCLILALGSFGLFAMHRASQDAFENGPRRVSPGMGVRSHWSRSLVLTVSSIVASMTAFLFPTNFTSHEIYRYISTAFDESGDAVYELMERGYAVERAKISSDPDAMVVEKVAREAITFSSLEAYLMSTEQETLTAVPFSPRKLLETRSEVFVYDPKGYVLAYTPVPSGDRTDRATWLLSYVVSRDKVSRHMEPRGLPFQTKPTVVSDNLIVTKEGMYWFDKEAAKVEHFVTLQVDGYGWEQSATSHRIFLVSGSRLLEYSDPSTLTSLDSLQPEASIEVGENLLLLGMHSRFLYKDKDDFTVIRQNGAFRYLVIQKRPGKELERFTSSPPKGMQARTSHLGQSAFDRGLMCMALPMAYILISGVIMFIAVYGFGVPIPGIGQEGGLASGMIEGSVLIMFQAILACVLAYVTARHRGLSKKARVGWSIAGSLGGFGVALAIIAIYPRCFREACTCCKKPRRVELLECEHCGSEWELPARDGIEVLENPSETENLVLQ